MVLEDILEKAAALAGDSSPKSTDPAVKESLATMYRTVVEEAYTRWVDSYGTGREMEREAYKKVKASIKKFNELLSKLKEEQ